MSNSICISNSDLFCLILLQKDGRAVRTTQDHVGLIPYASANIRFYELNPSLLILMDKHTLMFVKCLQHSRKLKQLILLLYF